MLVISDHGPQTNWFRHYDALVFIAKVEDVKKMK